MATNNSINNSVISGNFTDVSGNIVASAGDVVVTAGNITLANTNSGGTNGVVKVGGNNFIHNGGTSNTSIGSLAGKTNNSGGQNTAVGASALAANVTDDNNTAVGYQALTALNDSGSFCTAVGSQALSTVTGNFTSGPCVAVGYHALKVANTSGGGAVAVGSQALASSTGDSHNTAIGWNALTNLNGGDNNTAIGSASFSQGGGFSGHDNIGLGYNTGVSITGSHHSNIAIGNVGAAEDNTIRLGTRGTGSGQQNKCFIAAAYSNFGTRNTFVGDLAGNIILTTGSAVDNVSVGTSSLVSITTDPGNVAIGSSSLNALVGSAGNNVAVGLNSLKLATTCANTVAIGSGAMSSGVATGLSNVAVGSVALQNATSGANNVAIGPAALQVATSSSFNTAVGSGSLVAVSTGSGGNIALGINSGSTYTTGANNIAIGNGGSAAAAAGEIQIGTNGTHTTAFIQGISGVTVTGSAVLISTAGQMGTIVSSERYKDNIEDMHDASASLMNLRPVLFTYKSDKANTTQYGLIAEEVAEELPDLIIYDEEGRPETVQYHILPSLLLNELQKLAKTVHDMGQEIRELKHTIKQLKRS